MFTRQTVCVATLAAILCSPAMAEDNIGSPTLSFGYQYGRVKDYGDLHGGNIKLQYDTPSRWGVMGSLSAMKNNWQDEDSSCRRKDGKCRENYKEKHKYDRNAEYYSAMIGPTFRITDNINIFALAGVSHSKIDKLLTYDINKGVLVKNGSESSNQFAYGTGVTFIATKNLTFTAGFEGSQAVSSSRKHQIDSVYLNVGYRF